MLRCVFILVIGVLCHSGAAPRAWAYVLPADALCKFAVEARRPASVRDVTLQLNADLVGRDHQLDERLFLKRPERQRLVQQDDVVKTWVIREGSQGTFIDKTLKSGPEPATELLPIMFFPRGNTPEDMATRLCSAWQIAGIQTDTVTLARQGDLTAYVVGAHVWENDRSQVWLNKVTFAPIRIVSVAPGSTPEAPALVRDMRLLEYGQGPGGVLFPKFFEEYENGKLLRKAEVVGARFNQSLPETLFELTPRRH